MRRWLIAAGAAALAACASAAPPPGGAEDHVAPRLLRVTPDTNAVNVTDKVVTFWFDETINDRGSGPLEVGNFFLISPSDGNEHVSWHRSRIEVRPRLGFRPNTAYTVTMLPGLSDLRTNKMRTGASVTFSTGPTIPPNHITGVAFDWAAERPAVRALVQGIVAQPGSRDTITYLAQTDSTGHFTLGPLPDGTYLVRAVLDVNSNRALDRNEAYDSARVTVPRKEPLELLAIVRDTLAPHITSVTVVDSLSLRASFDRPLDQRAIPPASAFRLVGPDSVVIPVTSALTPRMEAEATKAAADARADSARRADSLAGKAPPAARAPTQAVPLPGRVGRTLPEAAKPSVPAPPSALLLRLAHPMASGTLYRLGVTEARALSGRIATSERTFTTPKPVPKPAKPAADTTRPPRRP